MRLMKKGVHGKLGFQGEQDAIVVRGVDVLKSVKSTLHVPWIGALGVRGEGGVNCRKVLTSHLGEPTDAAYQTLVGVCAVLLGRCQSGRIALLDGVDGVS